MPLETASIRHRMEEFFTADIVAMLGRTGVSPDVLTWSGFLTSVVSAVFISLGHFITGAFVLIIAGAFDMLDGGLARLKKQETRYGAFLDSTLDRLSEISIFLGLLISCLKNEMIIETVLAFIAMSASMMVSYVRARAEGLGLKCDAGFFTRPERIIVLVLGLFLDQILIMLFILSLLSALTAIQRIIKVKSETRDNTA
jgi:CDP-diacylglycerol---glycerol-3-phosphate 3-phosphatidyltransferase